MIGFLLGKPPERSPVLPDVLRILADRGTDVRVAVPGSASSLPGWTHRADCLALRGLSAPALGAAVRLEHAGVRCCNRACATAAVADRVFVQERLRRGAVAVPAAAMAGDWSQAIRAANGRPVVVKSRLATRGRGAHVVFGDGDLPPRPPFPGPYVVEERIDRDGPDHKLYVIGQHVAGLRKRWPRDPSSPAEQFSPDSALRSIARWAGRCLGLEIYGVDVLLGTGGPVVVDVNPFPSCAGIPGAAASIVDYLIGIK